MTFTSSLETDTSSIRRANSDIMGPAVTAEDPLRERFTKTIWIHTGFPVRVAGFFRLPAVRQFFSTGTRGHRSLRPYLASSLPWQPECSKSSPPASAQPLHFVLNDPGQHLRPDTFEVRIQRCLHFESWNQRTLSLCSWWCTWKEAATAQWRTAGNVATITTVTNQLEVPVWHTGYAPGLQAGNSSRGCSNTSANGNDEHTGLLSGSGNIFLP